MRRAALTLTALTLPGLAFADPDPDRGAPLFEASCAQVCHVMQGEAFNNGLTAQNRSEVITFAKRFCPADAGGKHLTETDLADIAAHLDREHYHFKTP